jgi:hypothetical protein
MRNLTLREKTFDVLADIMMHSVLYERGGQLRLCREYAGKYELFAAIMHARGTLCYNSHDFL